jgi:hypothetical protein
MNRVRFTTGFELSLDGDLLGILEALYKEVTLRRELRGSFEDMMREIESVVGQMSEEERKRYLVESLFLNTVTYENEMLDAYVRKLIASPKRKGGRGRAAGRSL